MDRVVVSLADARGKLPMDRLLDMKLDGVTFDHLASVYEEYTGKIAVENLRPSWLIFSERIPEDAVADAPSALSTHRRRGAPGLVLPLMAVMAAAGLGRRSPGRRCITRSASDSTAACSRSTSSGRCGSTRRHDRRGLGAAERPSHHARRPFLRQTRLDELPQLWNVLRGDMSLSAASRASGVRRLSSPKQIPFYGQRHVVKPGLTGWAQVRYTYGATVEDAIQKLQYDLFYIKNLSLALDLFIVIETVKTVVLRRGAGDAGTSRWPAPIVNALSVDVEDYFQVERVRRACLASSGTSAKAARERAPIGCWILR